MYPRGQTAAHARPFNSSRTSSKAVSNASSCTRPSASCSRPAWRRVSQWRLWHSSIHRGGASCSTCGVGLARSCAVPRSTLRWRDLAFAMTTHIERGHVSCSGCCPRRTRSRISTAEALRSARSDCDWLRLRIDRLEEAGHWGVGVCKVLKITILWAQSQCPRYGHVLFMFFEFRVCRVSVVTRASRAAPLPLPCSDFAKSKMLRFPRPCEIAGHNCIP